MRQRMNTLSEIRSAPMKQREVVFHLLPRTRSSQTGTAAGFLTKWTLQVNAFDISRLDAHVHFPPQLQRHLWSDVYQEKTPPTGSLYHASLEICGRLKKGNRVPPTMTRSVSPHGKRRKRKGKRKYLSDKDLMIRILFQTFVSLL